MLYKYTQSVTTTIISNTNTVCNMQSKMQLTKHSGCYVFVGVFSFSLTLSYCSSECFEKRYHKAMIENNRANMNGRREYSQK